MSNTYFLIATIISFFSSIILFYYTKKNFFKKAYSSYLWSLDFLNSKGTDGTHNYLGEMPLVPLFFAKMYFRKEDFWEGLLLYLLSVFFFVLTIVFYILWFKLS